MTSVTNLIIVLMTTLGTILGTFFGTILLTNLITVLRTILRVNLGDDFVGPFGNKVSGSCQASSSNKTVKFVIPYAAYVAKKAFSVLFLIDIYP